MKTAALFVGATALAVSTVGALPAPARALVAVSGLGPTLCATVYRNALQLNRCDGGDAQNWFSTTYGAQRYHGLCLDSATPDGGSQLVVMTCQNKPSQRWAISPNGQLKNESGWCTDVNGGRAAEGTRIQTWGCTSGAMHQRWGIGQYEPASSAVSGTAVKTVGGAPAGQVVAVAGGSIVAQGGGNVIRIQGGSIVAQGGGN